jgi:hypothetical protein
MHPHDAGFIAERPLPASRANVVKILCHTPHRLKRWLCVLNVQVASKHLLFFFISA